MSHYLPGRTVVLIRPDIGRMKGMNIRIVQEISQVLLGLKHLIGIPDYPEDGPRPLGEYRGNNERLERQHK